MADMSAAIKAAQEAAANIVEAEVVSETLPATRSGEAAPVVNYSKPSMETMGQANGISQTVDFWLKVDEFGLSIDSDRKKHDEIFVLIDMVEDEGYFVKESIKWGDPANYASRYNGAMADNGQPWSEVVARATRIDPRAKVFPSADIILVVDQDIVLKDSTVVAGSKMGLGLSMSNWRNWTTFYKEVSQAGLLNTTVRVRLSGEEVTGKKNGHTWGVIKMELAPAKA